MQLRHPEIKKIFDDAVGRRAAAGSNEYDRLCDIEHRLFALLRSRVDLGTEIITEARKILNWINAIQMSILEANSIDILKPTKLNQGRPRVHKDNIKRLQQAFSPIELQMLETYAACAKIDRSKVCAHLLSKIELPAK